MKDIVRVFKALSDPTRLRIVWLLAGRDLCVCELTYILDMSQSRVSHQLRLLRDADLVEDKRRGRWIIYGVPSAVRTALVPALRRYAGPGLAASATAAKDARRLGLCLRQNVRGKKGGRA
jgi:ArsR family transcriptional regulator, arsenate/arsenite/antimonite-responsive transcriptional repressor